MTITLNDDVLAYVLLDSAVGMYSQCVGYSKYSFVCGCGVRLYENGCEWKYISRCMLVCKQWKKVIDKYLYRYISKRNCYICDVNTGPTMDLPLTTLINVKSTKQSYKCHIKRIIFDNVIEYRTFLFGNIHIDIKYGTNKRSGARIKTKRKARITIQFDTAFNDRCHYNTSRVDNMIYPCGTKYIWDNKRDVRGAGAVKQGWKYDICTHILQIICKIKRIYHTI